MNYSKSFYEQVNLSIFPDFRICEFHAQSGHKFFFIITIPESEIEIEHKILIPESEPEFKIT